MKKTVKSLSIVAAFVLSVGLFSACGSENNASSDSNLNHPVTAESSTEEPVNTESLENDTPTQENEIEKYCRLQLLSSCSLPGGNPANTFSFQYDENYPPENFWLVATEKGTENENQPIQKYIAVDLDGKYIGAIDKESYYIISPFFDGISCVMDSETGERKLIDTKMEDVTSKYIDLEGGEQVVGVGADKTGTTLWTRKNTDTYDSHSSELFAKDLSGNIKQTWNSQDKLTEDIENIFSIEHINGANYVYYYFGNYVVLNVETGSVISVGEQHSGIGLDTVFDDGSYLTTAGSSNYTNLTWYSSTGEISKEILMYGDVANSDYGEGLMYIRGEIDDVPYEGFVDQHGTPVVNLDVSLNITNLPIYRGDYALVELENEVGETFVTLLDKTGKFAFEPIKGEVWNDLMGRTYRGELEGNQYYIKQNDDFYYLTPDGSTEKIEFDFKNCKGFLGKVYIVSDETFEVIE